MSITQMTHWQPRVMRHLNEAGGEEFAIHEVYFGEGEQVVAYTEYALSSREDSVAKLKASLTESLQHTEEVVMGNLNYTYSSEDIHEWLRNIEQPPVDYGDPS